MKKYGVWIATVIAAVMLLGAGGAKLAGVPEVHTSFAILGLPSWFGYFIGTCEVAGAIGLFIRPLSALAAAGVSIIALGALYFHAMHTPLVQGAAAFIILLLCVYIFFQRRSELFVFR
jgi:putative oxidoreductase